jgi:ATP-dependent DNA helicase RecG
MTATPIPRSLALTIFGDLDLSFMRELPKGRQPIETKLVSNRQRESAYDRIRSEVAEGRQAYVICPLVSESEKVQAKAAEEEYERLQQEVFTDLRLGLLHGQMKAAEKAAVMKEFAKGRIDVLVATSVVEVGIDVPNATVIAIEGAERFGLAQLYQMRGRVGRGSEKSYCLLFTDRAGTTARARLKKLVAATSGSEVAQADLDIRGPGELAGVRQAGLPDVAMRSLGNVALLERVREIAKTLLKTDPTLRQHPALLERTRTVELTLHLS